MSIKDQLSQIIDDPEKVAAILKLTDGRLSPQQRYMRSEKGKESKRKSNAKYASKEKPSDHTAALKFMQTMPRGSTTYESLTEVWGRYKDWAHENKLHPVKLQEFKDQLNELNIPVITAYTDPVTEKRVHRKVYKFDLTGPIE